ncbi:MAG: hypothetical protein HYZ27_11695 [Deltaproteobacteria bacterium]|nr:hypothetical protein [Deltaproteobacteria bacterium]
MAADSNVSAKKRPQRSTKSRRPAGAPLVDSVVAPAPFVCPVPPSYRGDVLIWDLDRTYLDTRTDTLRDLLKTAFQKARDKLDYPGVATLLRALRRGPDGQLCPTYFVTASPPQLADVIAEKLAMDGVQFDGMYFKDNLRNLRPGRFDRLREQMGYKLLALLHLRQNLPHGAVEMMFGDDSESDPQIYSLYGEILSGRIARNRLVARLAALGAFRDEAVRVAWRARHLAGRPAAGRIFIQTLRARDPASLRSIDPRIVPTRNYLQTALALHADQRIAIETVAAIAEEVASRARLGSEEVAAIVADFTARGLVTAELAVQVAERLIGFGILAAESSEYILHTIVSSQ